MFVPFVSASRNIFSANCSEPISVDSLFTTMGILVIVIVIVIVLVVAALSALMIR